MTILFLLPLLGAGYIILSPKQPRVTALVVSVMTMLQSIIMYITMDKKSSEYQYVIKTI